MLTMVSAVMLRKTIVSLALFVSVVFLYHFFLTDMESYWFIGYGVALFGGVSYLIAARHYYYQVTYVFTLLQLIGLTLAIAPYLIYPDLELNIRKAVYIHSIGLLVFLWLYTLMGLGTSEVKTDSKSMMDEKLWAQFFSANKGIFLLSLPGVLVAMVASGGWQAYAGLSAEGGYDRVASMKGMGPLMIFSVLNVFSGFFVAYGFFQLKKYGKALLFIVFFLC
ncbi:MAG: hypothetical protein MPW14_00080 [Candidatus Manganitrophus sp.]|nr:MAG: hypothetical protein MPW14_00080 [Candidatus Manganitrophus sp.]